MTGDLYLSPEFLAALKASGRTKHEIALAVAPRIGYAFSSVRETLIPGHRVPHNGGRNTIVTAICQELNFPVDQQALTPIQPAPMGPAARRDGR